MAITAPMPVLPADPVLPDPAPDQLAQALAGVSPTLAANEALDARRARGERVLPLAFGEAGVPVAPVLRDALAEASHDNGYGPVAGLAGLREAAAGYWSRRGLPTSPGEVVCGPGSKALLFGLLLGLGASGGADVAIPGPSWVSYAAQASLAGRRPVCVPVIPGDGGVPDPGLLADAATAARRDGRRIGAVIVTLPDNPTGTLASPATVAALCEVARRHDMLIISDEIYRDLLHDDATEFASPAEAAPERTVVTSGLSKNLALGGWRIGVARLPGSLAALRGRLISAASEIWSAPAAPVQRAAALAFSEPPEITERVDRSRHLHGLLARAVAGVFAGAGAAVPAPRGAFYLYPDFAAHRAALAGRFGVTGSADLAALLLDRYGIGVLPGCAFGDAPGLLRLRVATSRLYGGSRWQQEAALAAPDPVGLPWVAAGLDWLAQSLADLFQLSARRAGGAGCPGVPDPGGRVMGLLRPAHRGHGADTVAGAPACQRARVFRPRERPGFRG